jgi:hypothetical protein
MGCTVCGFLSCPAPFPLLFYEQDSTLTSCPNFGVHLILTSIFSGNVALDTLWGACFGSIFAGNPINSYIIGGELLKYGVSLFAVTAFIVTWVTVGLVQLPAEIAAFGKRFALLRNGLSFLLAIPVAIVTVLILNLLERWIS